MRRKARKVKSVDVRVRVSGNLIQELAYRGLKAAQSKLKGGSRR